MNTDMRIPMYFESTKELVQYLQEQGVYVIVDTDIDTGIATGQIFLQYGNTKSIDDIWFEVYKVDGKLYLKGGDLSHLPCNETELWKLLFHITNQ